MDRRMLHWRRRQCRREHLDGEQGEQRWKLYRLRCTRGQEVPQVKAATQAVRTREVGQGGGKGRYARWGAAIKAGHDHRAHVGASISRTAVFASTHGKLGCCVRAMSVEQSRTVKRGREKKHPAFAGRGFHLGQPGDAKRAGGRDGRHDDGGHDARISSLAWRVKRQRRRSGGGGCG